jgi:hypothetical protein
MRGVRTISKKEILHKQNYNKTINTQCRKIHCTLNKFDANRIMIYNRINTRMKNIYNEYNKINNKP